MKGFCPKGVLSHRGFVPEGFCPRGFCPRGFCPRGVLSYTQVQVPVLDHNPAAFCSKGSVVRRFVSPK